MINWKENEKGEKICPQGQVFNQYLYDKREEEGKYLKLTQVYGCKGCGACPVRKECTQGERRTISRNPILEEFQQKVDENLRSAEGSKPRGPLESWNKTDFIPGSSGEGRTMQRWRFLKCLLASISENIISIGWENSARHKKRSAKQERMFLLRLF